MRLINTKTLKLHEFFDSDIPPYAILSHRWGEQEITFQQMQSSEELAGPGYQKIQNFCRIVANKTSSAELSEAINSMFRWYAGARVCYAHLSDVRCTGDAGKDMKAFRDSVWFTRGWTLQELLAPKNVVFFDHTWKEIGAKFNLIGDLLLATGISPYALLTPGWKDCCIAQRMSWASKRKTTRLEDMAYCLMGLFDVNMPLLYGEGDKAFVRLQMEIIKKSDDESIFAWHLPEKLCGASKHKTSGMLALSPEPFADVGDLNIQPDDVTLNLSSFRNPEELAALLRRQKNSHAMTNKGLEFYTPLQVVSFYGRDILAVVLRCWKKGNPVVISLERDFSFSDNSWHRLHGEYIPFTAFPKHENDESLEYFKVYIKQPGFTDNG